MRSHPDRVQAGRAPNSYCSMVAKLTLKSLADATRKRKRAVLLSRTLNAYVSSYTSTEMLFSEPR